MSDQPETKKADQPEEQKNGEVEHVMSKGAKKRAKKQAKKAAEAASRAETDLQPKKSSDKTYSNMTTAEASSDSSSPTSTPEKPTTEKKTDEKEKVEEKKDGSDEQKENKDVKDGEKKEEDKDQPIPIIQRYDANGKPLKTIAGNGAVHLGDITPHNVLQLKKLNEAVFPILYNDKFYVEARSCGELGRLAYYNDVVVGAVCCRIDDISDEKSLYIMTLGTLASYRQIGIGTVLIDYVLKLCKKMEEIKTVHLHVQVNNMAAVHFYEKHGFTNDGLIENYYRISPCDAFLLFKRIRY